MKKMLVAFTVLCMLLTPLSPVQAQANGETVRIALMSSIDTYTVNASDYIVLHHRWTACTRGLVKMYLSAVHTKLGIDGEIISEADGKDQYWGPILKVQNAEGIEYCVAGSGKTGWRVTWEYPLGTLAPGTYQIYFKYWLDHPVVEGTKFEQNSRMNVWTKQIVEEKTFTIVVE